MSNVLRINPFHPGQHKLPPLPYPYNAIEPVIDERTMRIHHDKHHQAYVDDLNKAEIELSKARKNMDFSSIAALENALTYNGSGHILHSIFWTILTNASNYVPPLPQTKKMIDLSFGNFEAFKAQLTNAANTVQASGWSAVIYNPAFFNLEIVQIEKHQNLNMTGGIPILVIDVFEHAYYLKYQNKRLYYINNIFKVINFKAVEKRLIHAINGQMPIEL